jgi:hypothetical protein
MLSTMEPIGTPLQRRLSATRRWWRVTRLAGGLAWAVTALVCVALVCYHTDRLLALSASAREYWRLGIAAVGLTVLLVLWLRALLHRITDADIAADVERRFPVLRERLLTTISLMPAMATATGGSTHNGFSQSISTALAEETQRDAAELNFRRAVDTRPVRVAALAVVFTLALLAAHIALAPDAFANWVRRMASPKADVAPWANTRVWVQPSADVLPRGSGVNVVVTTRGTAAEQSTLRYRAAGDANSAWKSVELTHASVVSSSAAPGTPTHHTMTANLPGEERAADAVPPRQFRYHIPALPQSVVMYAVANDGRSNEKSVSVEDRPTLLNMRMTVHFPAYTRKAAQTMNASGGSIAAPTGSEIDIVAGANKPLRSAEFLLNDRPQGMWTVNHDRAAGKISVWKDATYSLNLVDRHGFDNPGSPKYEIRAMKDQVPTVQITRPTSDIDLQPAGSLPLVARAADDYGVNSMGLVYEMQHDAAMGGHTAGPHGALGLPGPDGKPTVDVAARWHIGSVRPNVGDTITYFVTATDNDAIDGPHTGRSVAFHVHVLSLAEMQKRMAEQINAEQSTLAELRKRQIEAQNLLRKAQQQPNAANLSKATDAQRAVAQEAKSAAQRIGDTSTQLENNNLATKSELARREEAEQMVSAIAQQKAPAAADNVQRAQPQKPGAAAHPQTLAAADKQESDIKHDIERAQEKLSPAPPPEELAKELMRLAKEQQDRADASHTLAEDINAQKKQSPGKPMAPEDRAALNLEKQHQADITRDTQRMMNQLQTAAKSAQERGQDKQAKALNAAAQALQKGQVGQNQQSAQQSLQKDSPAQAAPRQDKAASALAKASEIAKEAANQDSNESPRQAADRLEKTAEELRALAKQQKDLAAEAGRSQGAQKSQDLANQQKQLQNQTAQAQQNLSGSPQAQKSTQSAQQSQSKAGQQLSKNSPQSAQQPAQSAAQQLQNAADQAQNAAQQMRQQQAAQELADKVERLAQIQRGVLNTTQRLQNAQQKAPLSDNEKKELNQTAERQRSLEEQSKAIGENVPSPAFQQALQTASKQMHPATQNLNQSHPNTGDGTQKAQDRAAQTLETIAQALKAQASGGQQNAQQQQQQNGMSPEQEQQAAAIGDLMLAQGLQKQIRQNTGQLDKQRANQPLNPGQQQEADNLSQGERQTRDIANGAAKSLSQVPGLEQAVQQATQHMEQAGAQLGQQQTGKPTQGHQDQAIQNLDQAVKAAQQAMQQQQQQQQQASGQGMPMPVPGKQPGNNPDRNAFTRLVNTQKGGLLSSDGRGGKGFGDLNPRQQRVMRDGRNDPVPAEYRDLVKRYFGEKRGK